MGRLGVLRAFHSPFHELRWIRENLLPEVLLLRKRLLQGLYQFGVAWRSRSELLEDTRHVLLKQILRRDPECDFGEGGVTEIRIVGLKSPVHRVSLLG